jgi:hypothetical protein
VLSHYYMSVTSMSVTTMSVCYYVSYYYVSYYDVCYYDISGHYVARQIIPTSAAYRSTRSKQAVFLIACCRSRHSQPKESGKDLPQALQSILITGNEITNLSKDPGKRNEKRSTRCTTILRKKLKEKYICYSLKVA